MDVTPTPTAAAPLWSPAAGSAPGAYAAFRAVVAIPARDEQARLPACLAALAAQRDAAGRPFDFAGAGLGALVLANNCRDGTADLARALAPALPFALHLEARRLLPPRAHAGGARRAALDAALDLLAPGGVLLSTDADGRADPGWLAAHLGALAAGADAVAGRYRPDPAEAARLPAGLRAREAAEARYAALLDEIAARLDPLPHDPWPRHGVHSGASFSLTAAAYRRVGGLPAVPAGEDRALFAALERADLRVRHAPEACVTVSARLRGRARGGMADTMRHRLGHLDTAPLDGRLEPAADAWLRGRARRALRRLRGGWPRAGDPLRLALALGVAPARLAAIAALPRFGEAWPALEAAAPRLARRRAVAPAALAAETRKAAAIVAALRALDGAAAEVSPPPAAARPGGSAPPVPVAAPA